MPLGWEHISALTPWLCGPPYACSRVLLPHMDPKAAPSQHQLPITMLSVRVQIYSVNADNHVIRHVSSSHTSAPSGYCGIAWQGAPQVCRVLLGLYSCFCKIISFKNLLRTRAELSSLAPRMVWQCCVPCLLLPRAIASLAWTSSGAPSLHSFREFQLAMLCFELLSAQSNDYRSFSFGQAHFPPIYLNMLASGQFPRNVASFYSNGDRHSYSQPQLCPSRCPSQPGGCPQLCRKAQEVALISSPHQLDP